MSSEIPYLKSIGDSQQLYVGGKPFLILGAELHNSTASSLKLLDRELPKIVDHNINTVFLPIAWEQIERVEGQFDFKYLDAIIIRFREHKIKIGLLWFGSFKNGESSYVPKWVKTDVERFPRSVTQKDGKLTVTKTMSVFHSNNYEADAIAFTKLMEHLREFDSKEQTVILVQVENESGVLWDSRDRSEAANEVYFKGQVPQDLISYLHKVTASGEVSPMLSSRFPNIKAAGTWEEVFGPGENTEELFMAWHYAQYIDKVAAPGKEVYGLPLFINAALCTPESNPRAMWKHPGMYPSGGVVAHLLDVYKVGAPHIDIFAPDIYDIKFEECCDNYRHGNNPLLIPETRRDDFAAEHMFYAYGKCKAIGYAPFGIDTEWEKSALLKSHYGIMAQVAPIVLQGQAENKIFGFHFDDGPTTDVKTFKFGEITAHVERNGSHGKPQCGFGLIVQTGPTNFLGVGFGFTVMFTHDSNKRVEILEIREGSFPDGEWEELRWMNGDESASNQRWIFSFLKPDYGDYKVPCYYPAITAIQTCEVFVHTGEVYGMYPLFSNYIC